MCTLGPSAQTPEVLSELIREGMNVARLNFSHGSHEEHAGRIRVVRSVSEKLGVPVALMQDLQGPKIRVGILPKTGVRLETGDEISFVSTDPGASGVEKKVFQITYASLHTDVKPGERILMDDGLLSARVVRVRGKSVVCKVVDGGMLYSSKGVNFPDSHLSVSPLTAKDRKDLFFGVQIGVDAIALSFVKSAQEIHDMRALIRAAEKKLKIRNSLPILIIAKIEHREAIEHLDEIIAAADGVMVARGDLGIEMPAEMVPLIQKDMIEKSKAAAKPVIVATQMLDSMIRHPRATRAEVSDIANAVIDGADALMLSGETANGSFPIEAVRTMSRVIEHTEATLLSEANTPPWVVAPRGRDEAIAEAGVILAREAGADAMLVTTLTGNAARLVSRCRPLVPVFVETDSARAMRQMQFSWGLIPFSLRRCKTIEDLLTLSEKTLKTRKSLKKGDRLVVVSGEPVGVSGNNFVEIRDVR